MSNKPPGALPDLDGMVTNYSAPAGVIAEIAELRSMLESNPDSVDVREWLAFRTYTAGLFAEAVEAYQELIARGHRPGVQHFHLGNAYYKMKRYPMALESWKRTVELIPADPKATKAEARIRKLRDDHGVGQ